MADPPSSGGRRRPGTGGGALRPEGTLPPFAVRPGAAAGIWVILGRCWRALPASPGPRIACGGWRICLGDAVYAGTPACSRRMAETGPRDRHRAGVLGCATCAHLDRPGRGWGRGGAVLTLDRTEAGAADQLGYGGRTPLAPAAALALAVGFRAQGCRPLGTCLLGVRRDRMTAAADLSYRRRCAPRQGSASPCVTRPDKRSWPRSPRDIAGRCAAALARGRRALAPGGGATPRARSEVGRRAFRAGNAESAQGDIRSALIAWERQGPGRREWRSG